MNSTQSFQRFTHIDFLRGLAALLVIYQHTSEIAVKLMSDIVSPEFFIIQVFTKYVGIGEIGVVLFFMISGFVVPFSLTNQTSRPVWTFAIHRFFRLYPAYWLSVILAILFVWWRFGEGVREIDWVIVLTNISMLQAYFGVDNILGSYWTLSLELFFYAVCVALFIKGKLNSAKYIFLVFLILVIVREIARHVPTNSPFTWSVFFYLRYMGFMFAGLFFRIYWVEDNQSMGKYAGLMFLFTFLLMTGKGIMGIFHGDVAAWKSPLNYLIALALFLSSFWVKPNLNIGNFLGKISYSLYLFHPIIFYPVYFFFWTKQAESIQNHPHLFILICTLLTIGFSAASFYWLERPALALGKRLSCSSARKDV